MAARQLYQSFKRQGIQKAVIQLMCREGLASVTMDRVAQAGLRYTQFHSTALCSPTRAALITGRNHHSVGFGVIGFAIRRKNNRISHGRLGSGLTPA